MEISRSHALKKFKEEIGQANHMLITIMVGLDGIITYDVEANEDFHTSWNPKSKTESVNRSKNYAKKATLAWLVDCIDMYFRLINQDPSLVPDKDLKKDLDHDINSRSVYKRLEILCEYLDICSAEYALVDLLICWRNRLTHYQAENNIRDTNRCFLLEHVEDITPKYCGLDIQKTLESFDNFGFPTFKEVTSFVRATINLLTQMDALLIKKIGQEKYADRIFINYLRQSKKDRLNNIFSKDHQTAEKSIRQILLQNGFSSNCHNEVDEYCSRVSHLSFPDAYKQVALGTFLMDQN